MQRIDSASLSRPPPSRPNKSLSSSSTSTPPDALASLTAENSSSSKHESPRQPTRTVPVAPIAPPASTSQRLLARLKPSSDDAVKSASILKLVGHSERLGKSKDELVDEYKRARRAELEAMLRTMVHK